MSQLSEVTATSQSLTIILPSRSPNRKSNNVITFKRTKMHRHILGGMRLAQSKISPVREKTTTYVNRTTLTRLGKPKDVRNTPPERQLRLIQQYQSYFPAPIYSCNTNPCRRALLSTNSLPSVSKDTIDGRKEHHTICC